MKYRDHRGGLKESMTTEREVQNRKDLQQYLESQWRAKIEDMKVERYCYDERIGWDSYIVTILLEGRNVFYVAGFTNGALP